MYQALYRKYRPKTFEDVIGQKVIIQTLENAIKNNRLSHAYLFAGPRGTGKTSIAKILAKTINCEKPLNTTPCDICVNCTQYNNGQLIDIIEIDAASNNGVDEIREIRNKVNLVPNTGKYKVYIIDEVHMLTTGAFNALLKTLEEPPSHIVFILATTEPHKIPSTIISRCQRFDFKKISEKSIFENLDKIAKNEKIKIEKEALLEISRLSDGGMRDAISTLDQISSYTDKRITVDEVHEINGTIPQEQVKKIVENIFKKNISQVLEDVDNYNSNGKNLAKLLEEIMLYLKNALLYINAPKYLKTLVDDIEVYNINISQAEIIKAITEFNNFLNMMKNSSNQKIIFETAIIKLINVDNRAVNNISQKEEIEKKPKQKEDKTIKIKSEIEDVILDKVNVELKKELEPIKKLRINNALSNFNKKKMLEFKNKLEDIRTLILNPEYNYEASMVLDGKLKALGNDYLIFVYDTEHISDLFNERLLNIEKMFKNTFDQDYKIISTFLDDWNIIKKDFNSGNKKYTFEEETIDISDVFSKNIKKTSENDIEKMFDSIVEYK